jgi:hypothetical protein
VEAMAVKPVLLVVHPAATWRAAATAAGMNPLISHRSSLMATSRIGWHESRNSGHRPGTPEPDLRSGETSVRSMPGTSDRAR